MSFLAAHVYLAVLRAIARRMYYQREDAQFERDWDPHPWTHLERISLTQS